MVPTMATDKTDAMSIADEPSETVSNRVVLARKYSREAIRHASMRSSDRLGNMAIAFPANERDVRALSAPVLG